MKVFASMGSPYVVRTCKHVIRPPISPACTVQVWSVGLKPKSYASETPRFKSITFRTPDQRGSTKKPRSRDTP